MECPLWPEASEGDPQPGPACQKQVRRRRNMVYRPSPEEHESPTVWQKPPRQDRMPPVQGGDPDKSPSKRQRLQQGPSPVGESNRDACDRAGETLWRVASPMEKKQRKVLAVDLEDFSIAQVPEAPEGDSPLQRSHVPPCANPCPPTNQNEAGSSWQAKGQISAVSRSPSPKGHPPSCPEAPERLARACRKLRPQLLPPSQGLESERLQAKRLRLQKAAPPANGGEEMRVSALEKARQRIRTICLEDCSSGCMRDDGAGKQPLEALLSPCSSHQTTLPRPTPVIGVEKPALSEKREKCHQTDAPSDLAEPLSSWPPSVSTLLRPTVVPRLQHWGLVPVFQSMRSKLEAFADIFLSPSKTSVPPTEGTSSLPLCPQETEDQVAAQPGTPRRGVNIEVKIEISEPRSRKRTCHHEEEDEEEEEVTAAAEAASGSLVVSGRPPIHQWRLSEGDPAPQHRLGRSYSCPDFPGAHSWRASPPSLSLSAQLRQRRHTVCSLEVSRELGCPVLPCLRKEVYPFSTPPGRLLTGPSVRTPHCDGSSYSSLVPSCCLESNPSRSRDLSPCPDGGQRVPSVGLNAADSEMLTSEEVMLSESDIKGSQENTVGKVSCIRIRRTPVRQQANLTPMGLPRPVRLNKKEFSLEEIYTNKNYRTPTEKRSFETIFEVPLERNGALIFTSQRKLKRAMEFREGGLPRKPRKARSRGGRRTGGRRAQPQPPEMEERLQQRLAELDALFEEEEC